MKFLRRIRTDRSRTRGYRDLSRAMASAPTRASHEELLYLTRTR